MTIRSIAVLVAAAIIAGCGGRESAPPAPAPSTTEQEPGRSVVGILWTSEAAGEPELTKLDPLTLEPLGRRVALTGDGFASAFSPDRTTVALASGEQARIDLIDVRTMRSGGVVDLGTSGYVGTLTWQPRGLLLGTVEGQDAAALVAVDTVVRKVVERHPVEGVFVGARKIPAGIVALVAPRNRIGPVKLVMFRANGTASVTLDEITGGWESEGEGEDVRIRQRIPGLAVDPGGRRAIVVSAGRTVADIRLADLRVRYHALSEPVSLLGRLRNWLEPAAEAKSIEGPGRTAEWIASDVLAVSGVDYEARSDEERGAAPANPAGLAFVDTSDWTLRTVDDKVAEIFVAGRTLIGLEWWCAGDEASLGVAVFDTAGNERFRLCRPTGFDVQTIGRYAYLGFADSGRFEVVDLRTGQVVAEPTTTTTITLLGDS